MLRRIGRWLSAGLALSAAAAWIAVNFAADDPATWHTDPAGVALRVTPNEFLAAAPDTTAAVPHALVSIEPGPPEALLARFDAIVRAQPRVRVLAGSVAEGMITYVQRSRLMGFPDYITVKAVPWETGMPEGGAALIVWSRSRYGQSDLGVNRARVEAWLAELETR